MQDLKQYLLLIRLPNVFTALSNVVAGYFSLTGPSDASFVDLSMLMASSALLYIFGIILNDYFDLETDRKERPLRPLPSGRVSIRSALFLAVLALLTANVLAALVSTASLMVSALLSAVVFAYDYRLKKNGISGSLAMSTARFLNVFLGASPALLVLFPLNTTGQQQEAALGGFPWTTLLAAGAVFAYVYAIMLLSRKEIGEYGRNVYRRIIAQSFSIIIGMAVVVALVLGFYLKNIEISVNVLLFSIVIYVTLKGLFSDAEKSSAEQSQRIQHAIRNLVLSIVILDSIFITAFAGLFYGIASLIIIVPAVILAKKLYVT
jgi:4-hydroxybenzoate polyprenyltransferase